MFTLFVDNERISDRIGEIRALLDRTQMIKHGDTWKWIADPTWEPRDTDEIGRKVRELISLLDTEAEDD